MTTLQEMVYGAFNLMRGGVGNDNDPVSIRQMGRWIDQIRAEVLMKNWSMMKYDHTLLEQDPGVLKLTPITLRQYTLNSTILLDDRDVNTHNATPFYRNRWKHDIPELIGLPGHQDIRVGTGVDDVFTTPIISHEKQRFYRYLKFSGAKTHYCWSKGKVKIIPHLQQIQVEIPDVQDLTLAAKESNSQAYVIAEMNGSPIIDKDADDNDVDIYQPFLRIHGIFARPLEVEGWVSDDPLSIVKNMKTLRYPVTETLKEQIFEHMQKYYMNTIHAYFNDRSNNMTQEMDRLDSESGQAGRNSRQSTAQQRTR